jgi:Ca-activated chloride channel homolog
MRQTSLISGLLVLTLLGSGRRADSQANAAAESATPYNLSVSVDEVILTFHAADAHGLPINDLKLDELNLLDNGKPPRRVVAFQLLKDFPIRAGILMDTSESIEEHLPGYRAISTQYAERLLRQQTDQAFVMDFGKLTRVVQPWTGDAIALTAGIRGVTAGGERRVHGTAIFDAIYRACFSQFGKIDHAASGNFLLLFSDGEDNASTLSLKEAVDACERTNTAIYAFRTDSKSSFGVTGPKTLAELAAETGGQVFNGNDSDVEIDNDLRAIEADLRNQYRLIYNPAQLKHDGLFHRIELRAPERVNSVNIRSGYYAPAH